MKLHVDDRALKNLAVMSVFATVIMALLGELIASSVCFLALVLAIGFDRIVDAIRVGRTEPDR